MRRAAVCSSGRRTDARARGRGRPRIARRLTSVLQEAGYAVDGVGNGEEAWFRGDTEDYDAVILDLGLPRMDGLTVLKKWREAGRVPC